MSSPAPCRCFASLSRAELATVARCQKIARERSMVVVSSGVFGAEAGELAGRDYWLVATAAAPDRAALVWQVGARLMCGCKRRRSDGALTCAHAQCVRLALLAARGVRVPSSDQVGASAPAPTPTPADPVPAGPAPVAPSTAEQPFTACCLLCRRECDAEEIEMLGHCVRCLLDQNHPEQHVQRCCMLDCNAPAVGETADGIFCARHLARSRRAFAAIAERKRRAAEDDRVEWTFDFGDEDEEEGRADLRESEALAEAIAAE